MEELSPASLPDSIESAKVQNLVKMNKVLQHTIIDIARLVRDASTSEVHTPTIQSTEESSGESAESKLAFSSPFAPQNDTEIKRRRQEYRGLFTSQHVGNTESCST